MATETGADTKLAGPLRTWRIDPSPPTVGGQLQSLWRYRHVFWPLALSALFNVYRRAILGIVWMVIMPLTIALPAIFVVGRLFGISTDPVPLPLFIMVGLAAWILFRRCIQYMTKGLSKAKAVLDRMYAPPLLLLSANVSPGLFQFGVVLALSAAMMIYYGPLTGMYFPALSWTFVLVFPAIGMILLVALAVSCVTSILNLLARDTWLALRYVVMIWMLATPVLYPTQIIPETYRWIAYVNPLTVPVELFRLGILGYGGVSWVYFAVSLGQILIMLLFGIRFFGRMQTRIFDSA